MDDLAVLILNTIRLVEEVGQFARGGMLQLIGACVELDGLVIFNDAVNAVVLIEAEAARLQDGGQGLIPWHVAQCDGDAALQVGGLTRNDVTARRLTELAQDVGQRGIIAINIDERIRIRSIGRLHFRTACGKCGIVLFQIDFIDHTLAIDEPRRVGRRALCGRGCHRLGLACRLLRRCRTWHIFRFALHRGTFWRGAWCQFHFFGFTYFKRFFRGSFFGDLHLRFMRFRRRACLCGNVLCFGKRTQRRQCRVLLLSQKPKCQHACHQSDRGLFHLLVPFFLSFDSALSSVEFAFPVLRPCSNSRARTRINRSVLLFVSPCTRHVKR